MLHVALRLLFLASASGWLLLAVSQDEALLECFFVVFGVPTVWRKGLVVNLSTVFLAGIGAVISGALVGEAAFVCFLVAFAVRFTQMLTGRVDVPTFLLRAGDWGLFFLVFVHQFSADESVWVLRSLLTLFVVLMLLAAIVYVSVRAVRRVRY